MLVPCLGYGGAEKQITLISPYLKNSGYEVTVISMIPALAYKDVLEKERIKLFEGSFSIGKYSYKSFSEIKAYIKSENFDVLITFNYPANILGRLLKFTFKNLKVISSFRSTNFGSKTREMLIRITACLDSLTIPNSNFAAQNFINRGVVKQKRCKVIPNALDITALESSLNETIDLSSVDRVRKEFKWIIVGRFEKAKDYPTLIKAVHLLIDDYGETNFKVHVIGNGTLYNEVKQSIKDMGLEGRVELLGNKSAVAPYLAQADAFVLSSAWEGMPNAVMEAMLCKLPVVSTLAGGVVDLITDEINGFLVPVQNSESLASAMLRMMTLNEDERAHMGLLNKEKMIKTHSLKTIGEQWERAILSVVNN